MHGARCCRYTEELYIREVYGLAVGPIVSKFDGSRFVNTITRFVSSHNNNNNNNNNNITIICHTAAPIK
jgi:hypothetical protein